MTGERGEALKLAELKFDEDFAADTAMATKEFQRSLRYFTVVGWGWGGRSRRVEPTSHHLSGLWRTSAHQNCDSTTM